MDHIGLTVETQGLIFKKLDGNWSCYRAKIPGGWLVVTDGSNERGLTFVPDPTHAWNGASLP